MACLNEFQCALYAEGEMPPQEIRRFSEHVETCGNCRALVAALREESRVLVSCLQATDFIDFELEDESLAAPQAHRLSAARFAAFVLAMAVLLRPVLRLFDDLDLRIGWKWIPAAAGYLIPAGIRIVDSIWSHAGWIALASILIVAAVLWSRRSMVTNVILSLLALLTFFSSTSYGLDIRKADKPVTVPPGETVDDTLIVAGESAVIDGTVTGDVIAFVRDLTVRGTVKGNVVAFAREVEIRGTVEGSVIGFSQTIRTDARVARNVYAFAQTADLGREGRIEGNLTTFASTSRIEGAVARDAYSWTGALDVLEPARIEGDLVTTTGRSNNVRIAAGAVIGGRTQTKTPPPAPSRYARPSFYVWQTIWLAAAFLSGLAALALFPGLSRLGFSTGTDLLVSAGAGLAALVVVPIAAIIAAITLVGLPIGIIALAGWAVAVYLAKIVVAVFVGRSLLSSDAAKQPSAALILLAGLVPVFVAINLPYIGGLINLLLILFGLGAIAAAIYRAPRWRVSAAA